MSQPNQPAQRPVITATLRSAVIAASSTMAPEFVVTVVGKPYVAVELSDDPSFATQRRSRSTDPLRYFNTHTGLRESFRNGLTVAGRQLKPGLSGRATAGPAGTYRVNYRLDQSVWDALRVKGGPGRVYYRVLSFSTVDQNGQPGGDRASSFDQPAMYVPAPPYLIIRGEGRSGTYQPPAARTSMSINQLAALELDSASGRLRQRGASSTDPAPFTLRGFNVSGLHYRQFNWAYLRPGPDKPTCHKSLPPPLPGDPPRATGCYRPSSRWYQSAGLDQDLFDQLRDLNITVVRLPLNQDWVLHGYTPKPNEGGSPLLGEEYLRDVDQIVAWAAQRNIYTVLEIHYGIIIGSPERMYEPYLPDANTVTAWALLNQRYRAVPAVLVDLLNEPHPLMNKDDLYTGIVPFERGREREDWVELWHDWVRLFEEGLHDKDIGNPDALVFVSGIHGAGSSGSLRHMPVRRLVAYGRDDEPAQTVDTSRKRSTTKLGQPLPNLVYSSHLYCEHTSEGQRGDNVAYWLAVGAAEVGTVPPQPGAARTYPVFLGEWGPDRDSLDGAGRFQASKADPDPRGRVSALAGRIKAPSLPASAALVGWAAWSIGDNPHIDARDIVDLTCCQPQNEQIAYAKQVEAARKNNTTRPKPPTTSFQRISRNAAKNRDDLAFSEWGTIALTTLPPRP
jgi:hypothetical protein